jgi:hypothetical protein
MNEKKINKYNQYIICPICETVFNLIRSKVHINSKRCVYIQNIKNKGEFITLKEKLELKIHLEKTIIRNKQINSINATIILDDLFT